MDAWIAHVLTSLQCVGKLNLKSGPLLITCLVLNPSIRLTWIQRHWDREYVGHAETTIRQTVSLFTRS